jgi:16S rRNA (uracil1498-N3)-methyltransferase
MGDAGDRPDGASYPRFFVAPSAVAEERITFTAAQQHQLRSVLRQRDGMKVVICDGTGREIVGELATGRGSFYATILDHRTGLREPACKVTLFQSALRGDRFTWLLQKGTELGVSRFVPTIFARTQPSDYAHRMDRYQSIVREAAEQCERTVLPAIQAPAIFADALRAATGLRILLDERESENSLRDSLASGATDVSVFVGPEGGLVEAERAEALAAGIAPVTLGARILRSETAGLVAATIVLAWSNDLG